MTTNEDTRKAQECAAAFKPLAEMGGAKPDARTAALAAGFTIDDSTYPPIAYKGSRFQPTEWHNVPSETEATLSAQLAAMREANKVMEDALINIGEYWNGAENDQAMSDACHHNRETATAALARAAALGVKP